MAKGKARVVNYETVARTRRNDGMCVVKVSYRLKTVLESSFLRQNPHPFAASPVSSGNISRTVGHSLEECSL